MKQKKLLCYLVLISICSMMYVGASAQSRSILRANNNPALEQLFQRLHINSNRQFFRLGPTIPVRSGQQKPTDIQSRLSAYAVHSFDTATMAFSTPLDSTQYYWSGTNHQDDLDRKILALNVFFQQNILFLISDPSYTMGVIRADSSMSFGWNTDSAMYQQVQKMTTAFDANGNATGNTSMFLYNGIWSNDQRNTFTYDTHANQTSEISQFWADSSWQNSEKDEYAYDSGNKRTEFTHMDWDSATNDWMNLNKLNFSYNSQEQPFEFISQTWDIASNSWMNESKDSAIYDNGKITSEIQYSWDTATSQWENSARNIYSYDSAGKYTGYTFQLWVGTNYINI